MKRSGSLVAAAFFLGAISAGFAAGSQPVDPTQRNESVGAKPAIRPAVKTPQSDPAPPASRLVFPAAAPASSPAGEHRSRLVVEELRRKRVVQPARTAPQNSSRTFDVITRAPARVSTTSHVIRPGTVSKYQSALSPRNAVTVSRMPALSPGATVTINRFVFRRDQPLPSTHAVPRAGVPSSKK